MFKYRQTLIYIYRQKDSQKKRLLVSRVISFILYIEDITCLNTHGLLKVLYELVKRDEVRGLRSILSFFATSLINALIQDHEC